MKLGGINLGFLTARGTDLPAGTRRLGGNPNTITRCLSQPLDPGFIAITWVKVNRGNNRVSGVAGKVTVTAEVAATVRSTIHAPDHPASARSGTRVGVHWMAIGWSSLNHPHEALRRVNWRSCRCCYLQAGSWQISYSGLIHDVYFVLSRGCFIFHFSLWCHTAD